MNNVIHVNVIINFNHLIKFYYMSITTYNAAHVRES